VAVGVDLLGVFFASIVVVIVAAEVTMFPARRVHVVEDASQDVGADVPEASNRRDDRVPCGCPRANDE